MGPIRNRAQVYDPVKGQWAKIDTETSAILAWKLDGAPWKGVPVLRKSRPSCRRQR